VRGYARGHPHGNAGRAVEKEGRDTGRQHIGFHHGLIVVGVKIHRVLFYVGEHLLGDARHAYLGVPHGSRRVPVHAPEVALAIHQGVAHGETLGHAHNGVVHGLVAVGVVFAYDITHDACRFLVRPVMRVAQILHGVQDASVHRLEPVPGVRYGPADDDAHGVIKV